MFFVFVLWRDLSCQVKDRLERAEDVSRYSTDNIKHYKLLKPLLSYQLEFLIKYLESPGQFVNTSEKCWFAIFKSYPKHYAFLGFCFVEGFYLYFGSDLFIYVHWERGGR